MRASVSDRMAVGDYRDLIAKADDRRAKAKSVGKAEIAAALSATTEPAKEKRKAQFHEQPLHMDIMLWLDAILPHNARAFHIPNSAKSSGAQASYLKRMGRKPGVPDIEIIKFGMAHFVELKRPYFQTKSGRWTTGTSKLSDKQETEIERLKACDAKVLEEARSCEEVEAALIGWNILPKDYEPGSWERWAILNGANALLDASWRRKAYLAQCDAELNPPRSEAPRKRAKRPSMASVRP